MEDDDERVLVSAIAQYAYCPRRCALIHAEGEFEQNRWTLKGKALHERADDETLTTWEGETRVERALPLWSDRYGLLGKADVVEFHADGRVVPVEYKRGPKRAPHKHADLQLCAQALCMEEMLGVAIPCGEVFHGASHASRKVEMTEALREDTVAAIAAVRELLRSGAMPPPLNDARCNECSLRDICQPELVVDAEQETPEALYVGEECGTDGS